MKVTTVLSFTDWLCHFFIYMFLHHFFSRCVFTPFLTDTFRRICSSPVTTFSTVPNLFWPSAFLTRMLMWITHSNILNCMHQDFPAHFSTNESSSKAPYKDLSPVVFFFSLVTVRQPHLFIWWDTVVQMKHFVQKLILRKTRSIWCQSLLFVKKKFI